MTPFDCPRCGAVLTMSERNGIEIDYCPQCRGVWLDRNELDKIIERASLAAPTPAPYPGPQAGGWAPPAPLPAGWTAPQQGAWQAHPDDEDWEDRHRPRHGRRRKHWLSELFD